MKAKLLLISAFLMLVSCSSDDDNGTNGSNDSIVGTWKYVGYMYDGDQNNPPTEEYVNNECGYWALKTFSSDGVSIWQDYDDDCNPEGSPEVSQYTVAEGYLIYHSEGGDTTWQIKKLTSSELRIWDDGETLIYTR